MHITCMATSFWLDLDLILWVATGLLFWSHSFKKTEQHLSKPLNSKYCKKKNEINKENIEIS